MRQTEKAVRYAAIVILGEEFDEQNKEVRVVFFYSSYYESLKEFPERARSYSVINTPHITILGNTISSW